MSKLRLIFKFILFMGVLSVLIYRFWPMPALPPGVVADRMVIIKHQRQPILFNGAKILKHYKVATGSSPPAEQGQDGPNLLEGSYQVDIKKQDSEHYRVLHLARILEADNTKPEVKAGSPIKQKPASPNGAGDQGGSVMIRGQNQIWQWLGRLHCLTDCTAGCVALSNDEMDELWRAVPVGVRVEIKP